MGEVSWFQVAGSALAAVTAAFLASTLGVAGTLIGAAVASLTVTLGSAFFANTLREGRTLLVRTDSGTVIEHVADEGEVAEAFEEVRDAHGGTIVGAEFVEDDEPKFRWKSIVVTTAIVLGLALAAITAYELTTGQVFGLNDAEGGTSISRPFGGGGSSAPDEQAPEREQGPEGPTPTDGPEPTTPAPTDESPDQLPTDPEPTGEPEPSTEPPPSP